jgi:hypothetical protein
MDEIMFVEEPVKLGYPRQPKIDARMRNFAPQPHAVGRGALCVVFAEPPAERLASLCP